MSTELSENRTVLLEEQNSYVERFDEDVGGSWLPYLMDMQLGRNYLNEVSYPADWAGNQIGLSEQLGWVQIERLPMNEQDAMIMLQSWQNVLSACHTLNLKVAFVLRRSNGRTRLYLGTVGQKRSWHSARNLLKQCMSIHMPGAALSEKKDGFSMSEMLEEAGTCSGIITGIPSLQAADGSSFTQTLDKLARGMIAGGTQKDYALIVVADPASDAEILELQRRFLRMKSELHTLSGWSETEGETSGSGSGSSKDLNGGVEVIQRLLQSGAMLSMMTQNIIGYAGLTAVSAGLAAFSGRKGTNESKSQSLSRSMSREYKDFSVEYCENLIDRHLERMEGGRNLGFWQTGVYVLGDEPDTVDAVLAMLRSVYSGQMSYIEPVRVLNTSGNEFIREKICSFEFVPLPIDRESGWHVLGRMYESMTTPMTTQELSIATSLPQTDVPGLRSVKNAVHFASNPVAVRREDAITLGQLMDRGVPQSQDYQLDVNALVRHALIAGSTGSGKSTTCKLILEQVLRRGIPVLIIEPAKDDYVHWALEMNKTLPADQQFRIYMPGMGSVEGHRLEELKINPFEPAAYADSPVRLLQHSEYFTTLLNAALPSEDIIPVLIDEAVELCIRTKTHNAGIDIDEYENPQMTHYPTMTSLSSAGQAIIKQKTYAQINKDNFEEILRTRFHYLKRGTRGRILNTDHSIDYDELFAAPTVINLSCLSGSKDKALIMSLLLLALYEYRQSIYTYSPEYRRAAGKNKLMHLMLIEEAHNVLTKPLPTTGGGSPESAAADLFTSILSEIRSYGQGIMIVDQVPTRLIDDAIKNTNYKIMHRLTAPDDIEVMARGLSLNEEQTAMASSLEIGNAIVCGDKDDAASWVKIRRK